MKRDRAAAFDAVLGELRCDPERYFGCGDATIEPRASQARRASSLLHVWISTPAERYGAFVKIYTRPEGDPAAVPRLMERVRRDHATSLLAHAAMKADPCFGAVRPIACFPEALAIVTREVPGCLLGTLLTSQGLVGRRGKHAEALLVTLERVGAWLARFQRIDLDGVAPEPLDGTPEYVDIRLHKLLRAGAITAAERRAVSDTVEALGRAVPAAELLPVPVHADYCLGNVLVDGRRIIVIDFAMTRHGGRYLDLAHLYMQLQLLGVKPWFRGRLLAEMGEALLRGFSPGVTPDVPLFRLLLIQHVVNHLAMMTVHAEPSVLGRGFSALVKRRQLGWLREAGCAVPPVCA